MKNELKTMLALLMIAVALVPVVLSAAEYTQTLVEFNIISNLAYTVTLPDEVAVTSDPTASSAPTTMIYFNSTTGNDKAVNAHVAGGTIQSDGVPIMQFDNTGTTNITLSAYLNDTTPACIKLLGKVTWDAAAAGSAILGVTNVTGNITGASNKFGPFEGTKDWYMWTNFSECGAGQIYRNLITTGYN